MTEYDDTGKAKSWANDWSLGAPASNKPLTVICHAHRNIREGEEFEIALWPNETDNENAPTLTGKVQDKWKPQERHSNARTPHHEAAPAQSDPLDDPIPF